MNFLKRKKVIAFILGALFGALVLLVSWKTQASSLLFEVFFFPFLVGMKIGDIILYPVCALSTTNICRGLAFDGGPLEWVEYVSLIGGGIIIYGLLFVLGYWLYCVLWNKFLRKFNKKVLK